VVDSRQSSDRRRVTYHHRQCEYHQSQKACRIFVMVLTGLRLYLLMVDVAVLDAESNPRRILRRSLG